jgi:hypothetical protein
MTCVLSADVLRRRMQPDGINVWPVVRNLVVKMASIFLSLFHLIAFNNSAGEKAPADFMTLGSPKKIFCWALSKHFSFF